MEEKKDMSKYIDDFYKSIADKNKASDKKRQMAVALSLGYTLEDIENGGDLGLGCGNPIQNAKLKPGDYVLDLGCGKGVDVFKASKEVGETGLVTGVDRVPEMLERAKVIREKRKFLNTEFILSDIDDLKVEDNKYDVVISNCVINLTEDKKKVYKEIFRVLKPGGHTSISDIIQIKKLPDQIQNDPFLHAT